jgi:hypothetical protein
VRNRLVLGAVMVAIGVGCDGSGEAEPSRAGSGGGSSSAAAGGGGQAASGSGGEVAGEDCTLGDKECLSSDTVRVCAETADGPRWTEETCPSDSGCVRGACVVGACSDECTHGATDGGKTCELYDVDAETWVALDPVGSMHDRSRAYHQWIRRDALVFGGLGNVAYADPPAYSIPEVSGGLGDSALRTGSYLAAEALRLAATGSSDARANVEQLVETLHLWFNVSGDPGVLARYVAPSGVAHPLVLEDLDCGATRVHCGWPHDGKIYDYIGKASRDQYQGVMLGYALAYEALGPSGEAARALIRDDVVELVEELMVERTVPLKLTYEGTTFPAFPIKTRFTVLMSNELDGGAIVLKYGQDDSTWQGFQEFIPNLSDIVKQVPLAGLLAPDVIPRSSSAIMLASFFRVALLVTDGIAEYAARRQAIADFYADNSGQGGNIHDWMQITEQWDGATQCGEQYYGNHIMMLPMYNLARLEGDPTLSTQVDGVLGGLIWPEFANTKNVLFSFIYAGNASGADPNVVSSAAEQLAGFGAPPRAQLGVDLRSDPKYMPHQEGCNDQVHHGTAVDVADRIVDDTIWQREPWGLYFEGNPAQTVTGVDYLIAYWMGRHHQFLSDDAGSRCLRWK